MNGTVEDKVDGCDLVMLDVFLNDLQTQGCTCCLGW
jgi:hypothetical protein